MKYEYKINEDIKSNGGYILHFDGTTEKKCGRLSFVMMDSLSGHILACEMIESEKYEHVIKFLEQIKSKYGNPLATLSDLKPGFLSASEDAFKGQVLHIFCHYHFLGTFKEDFIKHHNFIKARLVSTWKIQAGLKKHLMALEKSRTQRQVFKNFEEIEKYWISSKNTLETYRHVLVWILKFKQDSSGKGIPFDLPYLDFYSRLMKGKKLIDSIFKEADARVENHYKIFNAIMSKAKRNGTQCKEFKQEVSILRYSRKWFNKLRGALFLGTVHEKRDALAPLSTRYRLTEEEANLIPQNLIQYLKELKKEISLCKNPEKVKILSRLQTQTEKYQKNLMLPIFHIMLTGKKRKLIPPRTNNCLESFFRGNKTLLRRNTGRSKLTKEFGSVGALLPYFVSMKDHKIFKPIFDDEQKLTNEFAKLVTDKRIVSDDIIDILNSKLDFVVKNNPAIEFLHQMA